MFTVASTVPVCVVPIRIKLISCAALQIILHKATVGAPSCIYNYVSSDRSFYIYTYLYINWRSIDLCDSGVQWAASACHLIDLRIASSSSNCSSRGGGGTLSRATFIARSSKAPRIARLGRSVGPTECGLSVCQGIKATARSSVRKLLDLNAS